MPASSLADHSFGGLSTYSFILMIRAPTRAATAAWARCGENSGLPHPPRRDGVTGEHARFRSAVAFAYAIGAHRERVAPPLYRHAARFLRYKHCSPHSRHQHLQACFPLYTCHSTTPTKLHCRTTRWRHLLLFTHLSCGDILLLIPLLLHISRRDCSTYHISPYINKLRHA